MMKRTWGLLMSFCAALACVAEDEDLAIAERSQAEAVRVLERHFQLAFAALREGEEPVANVLLSQRLLAEAKQLHTLPTVDQLKFLKKQMEDAKTIHRWASHRHKVGALGSRDFLLTQANKLMREADYLRVLSTANAEAVEVMKKSLAGKPLKEFGADQVVAWRGFGFEEIEGESFQVGMLVYRMGGIVIGDPNVQAKAYIRDGKVTKWVYAKTNIEIK